MARGPVQTVNQLVCYPISGRD